VHPPSHPVWFWFVLATPLFVPFFLWIAANTLHIPIKPLTPWLKVSYFVLFIPYAFFFALNDHKTWRLVVQSCFYTCWAAFTWIQRHSMFESLRPPGTKWYFPWKAVPFSVQTSTRILVRNIDAVSPWYSEKLGLRKLAESPIREPEAAIFVFSRDGKPIVLTTRSDFRTGKTPILFTKKIGKMRDVMMKRGVDVGNIERDRQGIQYFEIRDPEGNEIEVVQES
jgi:predicted enzyme related to lactoylglutathione lyase